MLIRKPPLNVHTGFIAWTGILFAFPLILSLKLRNFLFIGWCLFALYLILSKKFPIPAWQRAKHEKLVFWASILFSASMLISLLYSHNFQTGWFAIEKRLLLVVLPVLAYYLPYRFSKREQDFFLGVFVFSCFVLLIYQATTFLLFYSPSFQWQDAAIATAHFRYLVSFVISSVHPTYQALWYFFSALLLLYLGVKHRGSKPILIFFIVGILVFAIWGVALAARTPLIAFVLTASILVFSNRASRQVKITYLAILLLGGGSALFLPTIQNRLQEVVSTKLSSPAEGMVNSTSLRVAILHCSVESIKENWLLGIGIGDIQESLNQCYQQYETDELSTGDYDTHNQYFQVWMASGVMGIISFVLLLITSFLLATRFQNVPLGIFLLFLSGCLLTENLIDRNDGVILVALMIAVIGIASGKEPLIEEKQGC